MLPDYFVIVGSIIASLGGMYYLYETVIGKTKPNRVTFFLWGVFPIITFIAQKAQDVDAIAWAAFVAGLTPLLIFAVSFLNKKAYWKTQPRDYGLMVLAIIGIVLWAITDNPNLAIFFAILADFFAAVPTIIKCYKHPETESWIAYGINSLGFLISILAIDIWTFENYAFVVYLATVTAVMSVLSSRKPTKALHIEA